MPKIQRQSLINLTAFRQRNGILQKELADYLGVSRGYISLVESGRSTLAKESLEKIYTNPFHWDVDVLVPAYTRFKAGEIYLAKKRHELWEAGELVPDHITLNDDGQSEIKYGYSEIPEFLADDWCSEAPELNRNWLLTGEGEMLAQKVQSPSPIEALEQKIDSLEVKLKDLRALVELMPEKVVAALQSMSNK